MVPKQNQTSRNDAETHPNTIFSGAKTEPNTISSGAETEPNTIKQTLRNYAETT